MIGIADFFDHPPPLSLRGSLCFIAILSVALWGIVLGTVMVVWGGSL